MPIIKITGGTYRGRSLLSVKTTHPMGSRERLALMNALAPRLKNAAVLDAYAGTGALGIEALSRGADRAVFIEKDPAAVATLKRNLLNLGISAEVIPGPVEKYRSPARFDLIFADPPYPLFTPPKLRAIDVTHYPKITPITEHLNNLIRHLRPGGLFILSHPATFAPESLSTSVPASTAKIPLVKTTAKSGLKLLATKSYAAARISLFQKS